MKGMVLLAFLLLASACRPAAPSPAAATATLQPAATQTAVPPTPGTLTPASALPAGVPLYPGAHAIATLTTTSLGFTVDDPPDKVGQFYQDQLPAGGWKWFMSAPAGESSVTQTWTKAGLNLSITITSQAANSYVMIGWVTN